MYERLYLGPDQEGKGQALTSWGRSVILQHDIASAIEKNLTEQIPLCTEQLDRFLMTRHFETTMAMKPVVAQLCLEQRLNKVISAAVLSGWNVERAVAGETATSLFGLINGVTRAAQEMEVNGWYKLDELGGTLLEFNADRWEAMVTRAAKLSMKDVESTFGHWAYSRT